MFTFEALLQPGYRGFDGGSQRCTLFLDASLERCPLWIHGSVHPSEHALIPIGEGLGFRFVNAVMSAKGCVRCCPMSAPVISPE